MHAKQVWCVRFTAYAKLFSVHAQRSCTVNTSVVSDLLDRCACSPAHTIKSDLSQYSASWATRKTTMITEILENLLHLCSLYDKLCWPYNGSCLKQDIPHYMESSALSDAFFLLPCHGVKPQEVAEVIISIMQVVWWTGDSVITLYIIDYNSSTNVLIFASTEVLGHSITNSQIQSLSHRYCSLRLSLPPTVSSWKHI